MSSLVDAVRAIRRLIEEGQRRQREREAGRWPEPEPTAGRAAFVYERDDGQSMLEEEEEVPWRSLADQAEDAAPPRIAVVRQATVSARVQARLRRPGSLQEMMVLKEILDPPLARRPRTRR